MRTTKKSPVTADRPPTWIHDLSPVLRTRAVSVGRRVAAVATVAPLVAVRGGGGGGGGAGGGGSGGSGPLLITAPVSLTPGFARPLRARGACLLPPCGPCHPGITAAPRNPCPGGTITVMPEARTTSYTVLSPQYSSTLHQQEVKSEAKGWRVPSEYPNFQYGRGLCKCSRD